MAKEFEKAQEDQVASDRITVALVSQLEADIAAGLPTPSVYGMMKRAALAAQARLDVNQERGLK